MGLFSTVIRGIRKLRSSIAGQIGGIEYAVAKKDLEEWTLKRIQQRFEPRGSNPNAQREPSGKLWPQLHPSTVPRRRRNRNKNQALVDTGELRRSITVTRSNFTTTALRSRQGATFTIGIRGSGRVKRKAVLHNFGGTNDRGNRVPRRAFMGMSKKDRKDMRSYIRDRMKQ